MAGLDSMLGSAGFPSFSDFLFLKSDEVLARGRLGEIRGRLLLSLGFDSTEPLLKPILLKPL